MNDKVIIMDYGFYLHSSGWCAVANPTLPVSYTCLNMIISDLMKVGLEPEDTVIIGVDYHGLDYSSWRKQYSTEYKEGRNKLPTEIYQELNELLSKIQTATEWHVILLDHLEYDDIAAVASRYYKDKDVVVVSADCDMEQLWIYDNVKVFSPHKKSKRYKIKPDNFNIYKLLSKKIKKEAKDQVTSEIINTDDYDNRKLIMDLTHLPDWVENSVIEKLKLVDYKPANISLLPFQKMRDKYNEIYNDKSKIVTYEQSVKKAENKAKKVKAKAKKSREAKKLLLQKGE